jgi:HEAT repeat protein
MLDMRTDMTRSISAALTALFSLTAGASSAFSQPAPQPAMDQTAIAIAGAWTAIATGAHAEAVRMADKLLAANPRDHRVMTLKVEAIAIADPVRALDAYERWLAEVRHEDPFLLDPIARGTLEQIAAGSDTVLKIAALERLVRAGVPEARGRLNASRTEANSAATDAALARTGDAEAAGRLVEAAASATQGRAEAIADALPAAGVAGIPALRRLLTASAGPTRAAAVRALGKLDARVTLPELKSAMNDPDPLVRAWAAVSLARMGENQGEEQVARMLESPVADLRLIAAEAYADRGHGSWVSAILPLLKDPGGLTRLRAAELLAPVEPQAARTVLTDAAENANPVVRAEATRILAEPSLALLTPGDWPTIRRWLRDADPVVRLHGAGIVIDLVSGRR